MASKTISIATWKSWVAEGRKAQLVDVRSTVEFATAHLPNAINIPLELLAARADELDASQPVVLVCHTGPRAFTANNLLAASGKELWVLEGGTSAWLQAGNPGIIGA